jgi:8-oxo-dGTP diphosphatase
MSEQWMPLEDPRHGPSRVSVVRLIVSDRGGRVLILCRSDEDGGVPAWCLPGGRVEDGETIEAAAARELKEETGLRLIDCRVLFDQDSPPVSHSGFHVVNTYLECAVEGDVVLNAESTAYAWVGQRDLGAYRMVFGSDQSLGHYWARCKPLKTAP